MKRQLLYATTAALLFAACSEPLQETVEINKIIDTTKMVSVISHWGNKIEDPYSVTNMRKAYDQLIQKEPNSITKAGLVKEQITPTHLYIKFIPKTNQELIILQDDGILNVVPFPLTYDFEGFNGIYRDPECPLGQPTYQYSVVPKEYMLPNIEHIIIDSLYFPLDVDNDNYTLKKKATLRTIWDQLELESLKLTGNYSEEDYVPKSLSKRYHPKGKVEYVDDVRGTTPVPNARVHVNFSTHRYNCYTKEDGSFWSGKHYSNKVHFHVFFENDDYKVCRLYDDEIIESYGGKATSCNDFYINNNDKKAGAITHVAGYEFFHKQNSINNTYKTRKSIHFSTDSRFGHNILTFLNNYKGVRFNDPDYTHSKRYGEAINAFAGLMLEDYINNYITSFETPLHTAWRTGVEWYLSKDKYYSAYYDKECLIKDLIDADNSTHDKVSNYKIEDINQYVYNSRTWNDFKNELKKNAPSTYDKNNIDELLDYWKNR
ncbi:MAG: hypothetical protein II939_16925 [Bacteroidales bacterium]|nr:hypothetical protein [Bacteroidales bacterium]